MCFCTSVTLDGKRVCTCNLNRLSFQQISAPLGFAFWNIEVSWSYYERIMLKCSQHLVNENKWAQHWYCPHYSLSFLVWGNPKSRYGRQVSALLWESVHAQISIWMSCIQLEGQIWLIGAWMIHCGANKEKTDPPMCNSKVELIASPSSRSSGKNLLHQSKSHSVHGRSLT